MVCVSRSRLGRGSLAHFCIIFRSEMTSCSVSQKVYTNWVRPPRSKRDLETQTTYGPQTWQRGLRSVEHTPSKFGHDPCPVRRGLVAAVKCCVRKSRFFRCPGRLWNRTREDRALCGFQHHKGENLFCFLFSDPIVVGLPCN